MCCSCIVYYHFFFFNDTATTEIYTLSYTTLFRSQTDADDGPRSDRRRRPARLVLHPESVKAQFKFLSGARAGQIERSEEHTSELQSHSDLVCRLLLEKKKKKKI